MDTATLTKRVQGVTNTASRLPILPHAVDTEKQVIGGMMLDIEASSRVLEKLTEEDFYLERHSILFRALEEMNRKDIPVDNITLTETLTRSGNYEKAGGESYLLELSTEIVTYANIEAHCSIIKEKSVQRKLIRSCNEILEECSSGSKESAELLDLAESAIYKIGEMQIKQSFYPINRLLKDTFELIENFSKTEIMGVPSGFTDLDNMTGGFQPTDLIILAARPSMGKTAIALNMAANAALRHKKKIAVFSLEMSKEQLVMRILCSEARINLQQLRLGRLPKREYPKLLDVAGDLNDTQIFIDDNASQTSMQIRSKCRRIAQQAGGLDMVIIDYLQLMSGGGREENRQQEISQISRSLKGLAKELGAPVIALSQLNRSVESRTDGKPMLSDLRESGAIEQDADLVMFIHRPEVRNPEDMSLRGLAEIIIAKQRNGPIGAANLTFLKESTTFANYTGRQPEFEGF